MAKRNYKKKKSGMKPVKNGLTAYRPKYQSGVPSQTRVKLVYSCPTVCKNIDGTFPFHWDSYRLNSLYDPEETPGGGQPRFFDQYTGMYDRYRVTHCTIETEAYLKTDNAIGKVYIIPNAFNAYDTLNAKEADEHKNVTSHLLTSNRAIKIKRNLDVAQVEGVRKSQVLIENDYSQGSGGNPLRMPYVQVAVSSLMPGDSMTICLKTNITYYGIMYQPKQVGPS